MGILYTKKVLLCYTYLLLILERISVHEEYKMRFEKTAPNVMKKKICVQLKLAITSLMTLLMANNSS